MFLFISFIRTLKFLLLFVSPIDTSITMLYILFIIIGWFPGFIFFVINKDLISSVVIDFNVSRTLWYPPPSLGTYFNIIE